MLVLIIPAVGNVDDAEVTCQHGGEVHPQLKDRSNNNELKIGTKNAQSWCLCQTGNLTVTIQETSEKADYITQRHRRLQDRQHIYCNLPVQGITLSGTRLYHTMSCAPDKELCFVLFEHLCTYVTSADGFNGRTIEYHVETKDGENRQRIARAQLSIDSMIDGKVNTRDREQVLEHYLEKIASAYNSLYIAVESNAPVNLSQLVKGQSPAAWAEALPVLQALHLFGDGRVDGCRKWHFIGMFSSRMTII